MAEVKHIDTIKQRFHSTIQRFSLDRRYCLFRGVPKDNLIKKIDLTKDIHYSVKWGLNPHPSDDINFYLRVNVPTNVKFTVTLCNSFIKQTESSFVEADQWFGFPNFASINQIQTAFSNNFGVFQIEAEFEVDLRPDFVFSETFKDIIRTPYDSKLIVDKKVIEVHKNVLTEISPVFNAGFNYDTIEAKTNEVIITDYDYETVDAVIGYFYGRPLKNKSVKSLVNVLRCMDKYGMESKKVEDILLITHADFLPIVHYAYDCCKDVLFSECAVYFAIRFCNKDKRLVELPVRLILELFKQAHSLETDLDVLHYTENHNLVAITEYLETKVLRPLELNLTNRFRGLEVHM